MIAPEFTKGLAAVKKTMDRIENELKKDAIDEAMKAGAEVVKETMARNAMRVSGRLASSIRVAQEHGKARAKIGPTLFWGYFHEFGTSQFFDSAAAKKMGYPGKHGRKRPDTGGHPATPFARPALLSSKREAFDAVADVLRIRMKRFV